MADLALYLGITAVGFFVGGKMKNIKDKLRWTGKMQTLTITLLVLLMGMRMGSNSQIIDNLKNIGLSALVITIFTMAFSIVAIYLSRKFVGIDRRGMSIGKRSKSEEESLKTITEDIERLEKLETSVESDSNEKDSKPKQGMNMMTVMILVAVVVGMLVGFFYIREAFGADIQTFDDGAGLAIKIGLCVLLALVGIDLGIEGTVVENFKSVGLRILVFPFATVVGTMVGALICAPILGITIRESLAVGAGFGWYTLAPGLIMEAGYINASAIAFLHNVMRELSAIVLIPIVAQKIGYIETTGMPGAAAMDVCLPIVERSTRSDIAVYSFVSGVVLTLVVPILVPLIINA